MAVRSTPRASVAAAPSRAAWSGLLAAEGERTQPNVHTPLLLDDPETVWFVEAGGLLVFTAVIDGGAPQGIRRHLLDVGPGECVFGFDRIGIPDDIGAIAVVRWGTVLRVLLDGAACASWPGSIPSPWPSGVDVWIERLSTSLMRGVAAQRAAELTLVPACAGGCWPRCAARRRRAASSGSTCPAPASSSTISSCRVSWRVRAVPVDAGHLCDAGRSRGCGRSTRCRTRPRKSSRAPRCGTVCRSSTHVRCARGHEPPLAEAEEFLRLRQKAHHANAAQAPGIQRDRCGAAARRRRGRDAGRPTVAPTRCSGRRRLVGQALGIDLAAPADDAGDDANSTIASALIASASGVRMRQVALRDDWWQTDDGPLLARHRRTKAPVALIPIGADGLRAVRSGVRRADTRSTRRSAGAR